MRFVMNKNKTTKKTDAYVKLMLYSIAEKFVTLNDALLPEYKRFTKANKHSLSKLYRLMRSVSRKLAKLAKVAKATDKILGASCL